MHFGTCTQVLYKYLGTTIWHSPTGIANTTARHAVSLCISQLQLHCSGIPDAVEGGNDVDSDRRRRRHHHHHHHHRHQPHQHHQYPVTSTTTTTTTTRHRRLLRLPPLRRPLRFHRTRRPQSHTSLARCCSPRQQRQHPQVRRVQHGEQQVLYEQQMQDQQQVHSPSKRMRT